jgi:solute carrier family 35, member E1
VFLLNGLSHWLQTVLAFKVLQLVSPVTYSVANSLKRVFVIVSSVIWFGNWVSPTNALGILIAIIGVFLYNRARLAQRKAAEIVASNYKP